MKKRNVLALATLGIIIFFSACGGSNGISPSEATVTPASADLFAGSPGQTQQFTSNVSTKPAEITWSVNGTAGGDSTNGTIDATGLYTAPAAAPAAPVTVTATKSSNSKLTASATVNVVSGGTVTATANPQVAAYTITLPVQAGVTVNFGPDTTYGFSTSQQQTTAGTPLTILVAGMKGGALYHINASILMPDGTTLTDADHTFTTVALAKAQQPVVTVTTPNAGLTPQPGVQMLDMIGGNTPPAITLDLQGNLLWYYIPPDGSKSDIIDPIKQLPNGDFLVIWAPSSSYVLTPNMPLADGTVNVLREIDLTGKTVRQIDIDTLNSRLATAGMTYTALTFHHDVAILPNGHFIVLVNSLKTYTGLPGQPGGAPVAVLGDALVELDNNLNPVWLWDEFDHLDIDREPFMFPDWTHSNAVLYSPSDGNLLVSVRHQSWIIKIDYEDGKGSGNILWRLGYQGDFTLDGGTDPTDWFYAEHGPAFTSSTTAGQFGLSVFDNGDDRKLAGGLNCTNAGISPCPYSTAKVFNIDETAMTATIQQLDPTGGYSNFGGNAEVLANGNLEADSCYTLVPTTGTTTTEQTADQPAELVWSMHLSPGNAYRSFRMSSLYPNVQW